ncbi:RluA family pseudouridine synthase [Cytobacillus sp. IB215665]|uniref:RluA family pseudouridine synthase n=1 Tax=Cytobacillus sp. IB215665 TaxID=3097357 RepID=UPI002A16F2B1|nr:RluA family pseudouridine synthase [Cytobacillus sp. IB215665]MDX8364417.1 RluA family pseudouridine synthase [Cytobacillus sp. IB215665]
MKNFKLQWIISDKDHNKLIRDFLKQQHISKASLTDIKFAGGDIIVNGKSENVRYRLKQGDQVIVVFPIEPIGKGIVAENIPLQIIYEDEYLLIINKRPNLPTIPSRQHPERSLANGLMNYYKEKGLQITVHIVTRLDRDTSGLVLVAKHRHIHHLLSQQQQLGQIKRVYYAIVNGLVTLNSGTITSPIGRKSNSIIEREVRDDGQKATTHFQVIRRYPTYSLVQLRLETGRTHQIRVHMSHIGHPLEGDTLYGGTEKHIKRQALHCHKLTFCHPVTHEELVFQKNIPDDMHSLTTEFDK